MTSSTETTFRIALAPPPDNALSSYGLPSSTTSGGTIDLMAAAFANADYVLGSSKSVSRYSTGDWPVLYTATSVDTAIAEKGYGVNRGIFSKNVRPDEVECLEYTVSFEGVGLSVIDAVATNPQLVHPTDYRYCWSVAKDARDNKVDFLIVPSARRIGGVNINLFHKTAKFEIGTCVLSVFKLGAGGVVDYVSSSLCCPLVVDDVFQVFS